MSEWSVKSRRAPSRHCRDARVYGQTTMAMHEMSECTPFPSIWTWPYRKTKRINSKLPSIRQRTRTKVPKATSQEVFRRIQLAAHRSYGSLNTSRRFALGASSVCLLYCRENPTCPVPHPSSNVCLVGETQRAPSRQSGDARVYELRPCMI